MEYFSNSMEAELFCESCSVPGEPLWVEERIERLMQLLSRYCPRRNILEICCGNGMATQALERLGHSPYAMDSDRCDLCTGLKSGRMDPSRCFVLDARLLPRFFPSPILRCRARVYGWPDRCIQLASLEGHPSQILRPGKKEALIYRLQPKGSGDHREDP